MQVCASQTEHQQAEQMEEKLGRSTPCVVHGTAYRKMTLGTGLLIALLEILILVRQQQHQLSGVSGPSRNSSKAN